LVRRLDEAANCAAVTTRSCDPVFGQFQPPALSMCGGAPARICLLGRLQFGDTAGDAFLQRSETNARMDAGPQLLKLERFYHVVVSARLQRGDHVLLVVLRGEENHVHPCERGLPFDSAAELEPVDAGHHPVDDGHRRWWRGYEQTPGGVAI